MSPIEIEAKSTLSPWFHSSIIESSERESGILVQSHQKLM